MFLWFQNSFFKKQWKLSNSQLYARLHVYENFNEPKELSVKLSLCLFGSLIVVPPTYDQKKTVFAKCIIFEIIPHWMQNVT